MGPKVGAQARDIPFDTQFLLIEIEEDENYALMLPMVDNGFRAFLHYGDDSDIEIICAAESGDAAVASKEMRALYVAVGDNPFDLIKKSFADVAETTGTFQTLDEKKLPPSVDDFGWCTWDAFYSKVNPEGILEGVEALRNAGVPPRTLILDDGWQQVDPKPSDWLLKGPDEEINKKNANFVKSATQMCMNTFVRKVTVFYEKFVRTAPDGSLGNKVWKILSKTVLKPGLWDFFDTETDFNRQLSGFDANFKFEKGDNRAEDSENTLRGLVSKLKGKLGVKSVYCWHALHGYWRGVSEELGRKVGLNVKNIHPQPSKSLRRLEPQSAWDPVSLFGVGVMTTQSDLKKFYELIHTPLVEAGIDGVKVDVQSGVSAAGDGVSGRPHISKLYTMAMEDSVSKRFAAGNGAANCINCMCHSTENLYRYRVTSVARASEDFFPGRPESHTAHLVNVAYNSLFIGEICLPDWDMFHSLHESAELHGAARAIGGCPVYVSDEPGKHNPQLLQKLVLPDGSILRAKQPGRPTRDSLFVDVTADETSALKIWNQNSYGGVVGAFNVQGVQWNFNTHENEVLNPLPPRVYAQVKPYDIESMRKISSGPFVAWQHRSSNLEFLTDGKSVTTAALGHRDWEIFTIVPVQMDENLMWAPIGLSDMMNSGGAIQSAGAIIRDESSSIRCATIETRGPGRFIAFTNVPPSRVMHERPDSDSTQLDFLHDKSIGQLSFMLPPESSERTAHRIVVEWN